MPLMIMDLPEWEPFAKSDSTLFFVFNNVAYNRQPCHRGQGQGSSGGSSGELFSKQKEQNSSTHTAMSPLKTKQEECLWEQKRGGEASLMLINEYWALKFNLQMKTIVSMLRETVHACVGASPPEVNSSLINKRSEKRWFEMIGSACCTWPAEPCLSCGWGCSVCDNAALMEKLSRQV